MIQVIQAPSEEKPLFTRSVFLAGGINQCPNWQDVFLNKLSDLYNGNVTIYNPRRSGDFKPEMHKAQVDWETRKLEESTVVVFWFCHETLCPITLYEYGWIKHTDKVRIVGAHPDYQRRNDILFRERQFVFDSLDMLATGLCVKLVGGMF